MPVDFRIEGQVLVVTISGETSDAEHREARKACAGLCRRRGLSRLLVDLRGAVVRSSLLDTYLFTASLPEGFPPGTMYAVLISPSTIDPERSPFSEEVAAGRGIRLRVFSREDEAREWLGPPRRPRWKRGRGKGAR